MVVAPACNGGRSPVNQDRGPSRASNLSLEGGASLACSLSRAHLPGPPPTAGHRGPEAGPLPLTKYLLTSSLTGDHGPHPGQGGQLLGSARQGPMHSLRVKGCPLVGVTSDPFSTPSAPAPPLFLAAESTKLPSIICLLRGRGHCLVSIGLGVCEGRVSSRRGLIRSRKSAHQPWPPSPPGKAARRALSRSKAVSTTTGGCRKPWTCWSPWGLCGPGIGVGRGISLPSVSSSVSPTCVNIINQSWCWTLENQIPGPHRPCP